MTITDVKAVYPNWRNRAQGAWQAHFWQIVVRIETDAGVTGYGYGGGGEPGVLIINGHLRELLIGKTVGSIKDIRTIWDHLYFKSLPYGRKGITLMALSGVDLAMWDLLGRAEDKPVYDLLGGMKKNPVRAYATGQDFARARDLGYTAVKFSHRWQSDADYDTAIEQAGQARKRLDPDTLLMMDCYMSWDAEVTLEMHHLLTDYRIYWFEDVLTPDHLAELAALRPQLAPVLLAGGEHDFSHHVPAPSASGSPTSPGAAVSPPACASLTWLAPTASPYAPTGAAKSGASTSSLPPTVWIWLRHIRRGGIHLRTCCGWMNQGCTKASFHRWTGRGSVSD